MNQDIQELILIQVKVKRTTQKADKVLTLSSLSDKG